MMSIIATIPNSSCQGQQGSTNIPEYFKEKKRKSAIINILKAEADL